jgi:hypothetical protein
MAAGHLLDPDPAAHGQSRAQEAVEGRGSNTVR